MAKSQQENIFHARFGQWADEKTLVFGEPIDIPCNIVPMVDNESPHDPKNHIQIAEGIFAVGMAGMDDTDICLYEQSGNPEVRFQIDCFSFSETPRYFYLRDRRQVLEISHDSRVQIDLNNEEFRKLNPHGPYDKTGKFYVFSRNALPRLWPPQTE